MAVKPTTTFTFATNANYGVGPFIGSATKIIPGDIPNGFVPATGIVAEWNNYMFFHTGDWLTRWLDLGTSSDDLDAHIIETDASGGTAVASTSFGGTASASIPLIVNENSGFAAQAASFKHSTGTAGLFTSASPVEGTIWAINTGVGPAVHATALGTDNVGIEAAGIGTGTAGNFVGGDTGIGILGTGGATAGAGGQFLGTGTQPGVRGTGSATGGAGVLGIGGSNNFGGLEGQTNATSSSSSAAVRGTVIGGAGSGVTGNASAGDGYGVIAVADATSPVSSALRISPQDDDPSVGADGDVLYNGMTNEFRVREDIRWMSLTAQENGFTRVISGLTTATNNNSAVWTTVTSITLTSPYEPKHTGVVLIQAAGEFGSQAGTIHTDFELRIQDTTSAATVWSQTIDHPAAVAGSIYDRPWSIMASYALPAIGNRNFTLEFRRTGAGGTGIQARDASLYIHGVY